MDELTAMKLKITNIGAGCDNDRCVWCKNDIDWNNVCNAEYPGQVSGYYKLVCTRLPGHSGVHMACSDSAVHRIVSWRDRDYR